MKKTLLLTLAFLFVASYASAAQVESTTTNFALGSTSTLTVGLSNEVTAVYDNGGATKPQWYTIGTYHLGGDKVFATAQDITNIYSQAKEPGAEADWSGLPTGDGDSNVWSTGVWKAL